MGSTREARAVLQVSDPGPPSVMGRRSRSSTIFHSRLPRVSSSATSLRARLACSRRRSRTTLRSGGMPAASPRLRAMSSVRAVPSLRTWPDGAPRSGGGVFKIPLPNIHPPATVARQIGFREQRWREYRAGLHGRRGVQENPGFPGVGRRGTVPRDRFLTTSRPLAGERRTGSDARGCPGAWFDPRGGSVPPTEFVRGP